MSDTNSSDRAQEPVAWRYRLKDGHSRQWTLTDRKPSETSSGWEVEPLYAAASETQSHEPRKTQQAALYNLIKAWNQLPTACKDECDGYSTFDKRGRAFFDAAIAVVKEAIK